MSNIIWIDSDKYKTAKNVTCDFCGDCNCVYGAVKNINALGKHRFINRFPKRAFKSLKTNKHICVTCFDRM